MCTQCLCIVLAQCHSAAKRRGLLPLGGRFVAEIFVQNLKWRVSQRGADVSYILIQLLLLYLKNLLSYTAWHHYFQAFLPFKSLPATACVPMPLYCTCSVSQRCKKTRATSLRRPFCSLNILPKFKMTGVSERGRRKLYFDPTVVTVSQKLAELYSLTSLLFSGFVLYLLSVAKRRGLLPFGGRAIQIPPSHIFIMRVYTIQLLLYCTCSVSQRCVVLYLLKALQKDEGYFPSAADL